MDIVVLARGGRGMVVEVPARLVDFIAEVCLARGVCPGADVETLSGGADMVGCVEICGAAGVRLLAVVLFGVLDETEGAGSNDDSFEGSAEGEDALGAKLDLDVGGDGERAEPRWDVEVTGSVNEARADVALIDTIVLFEIGLRMGEDGGR